MTLALLGQRERLRADDAEIDSSVSLIPSGGGFQLGVELRISLPSIADGQAVELVKAAHQVCPYSHATRDNIDVALLVNGTRL